MVLLRNMHNRSGGPTTRFQFLRYCLSRNFFVTTVCAAKKKRIRYRKTLFYRYLRCNLDILAQHANFIGPIHNRHKKTILECKRGKNEQRNFLLFIKEILNAQAHSFSIHFYLTPFLYCTLRICHINRTPNASRTFIEKVKSVSIRFDVTSF